VERVLEADPVEVLPVTEQGLPLAVRGVELGVLLEDLLGAGVEPEVDRPVAEVLAEVVVLLLALLPAGGDGRDAALDAELGDGLAEGRVEALRAEQDDGAGVARDHAARTFSVWPTVSSMARS